MIKMPEKLLCETVIGSHAWKMNHAGSDLDLWRIFVVDTKQFLRGTVRLKSRNYTEKSTWEFGDDFEYYGMDIDYAEHEVGSTISQLLKGNINYLIGILSPIVRESTPEFNQLREITQNNIAKNCFNSIHGMGRANYNKYIKSGKDDSERRCNKIARALQFGIEILDGNGIQFEPYYFADTATIKEKLNEIVDAFHASRLPDAPNPEPFRDWLLEVRLNNL